MSVSGLSRVSSCSQPPPAGAGERAAGAAAPLAHSHGRRSLRERDIELALVSEPPGELEDDSSESWDEDDDGDWDSLDWWALIDDDQVEYVAGREFETLRLAQKAAYEKLPTASSFAEKRRCLLQLEEHWATVTPKSFVRNIVTLGEDAHKYLRSLSLRMKAEEWEEHHDGPSRRFRSAGSRKLVTSDHHVSGHTYKLHHALENIAREPGGKIKIERAEWDQHNLSERLSIHDTRIRNFVEPWESERKGRRSRAWRWLRFIMQENKTEYWVHWSKAAHLIHPTEMRSQIHIIRALADSGSHSQVFNTAVGRAIQTVAWQQCQVTFFISMAVDIFYILLLFAVGGSIRAGVEPSRPVIHFAFAFSLFRVGLLIVEVISTVKIYGSHALSKLGNKMNAVTFVLEGLSSFMMISVFSSSRPNAPCIDQACYLWSHPVCFAFTIFGKWCALIWSLFCMPYFGEHALPAIYAGMHTETVMYACFLTLVIIASWHAYWSFPIRENIERLHNQQALTMGLDGIDWSGLMKIFNLELLGDFSLWDLEGQDPLLNATIVNGTIIQGNIGNRTIHSRWHYGLQMLFVIWSVSMTITFMNVAIGITSNLFNMHKSHKHQIHLHFKANYTYRVLLWHYFFLYCVPWALRLFDCLWEPVSAGQRERRMRLRRELVQHKRGRRERQCFKESRLDGIWRNQEGDELAISLHDILRQDERGDIAIDRVELDGSGQHLSILLGDEAATFWPSKPGEPARLETEESIWTRQVEGSWIVFDPRTFMDEPGSDNHSLLKIEAKLRDLNKAVGGLQEEFHSVSPLRGLPALHLDTLDRDSDLGP